MPACAWCVSDHGRWEFYAQQQTVSGLTVLASQRKVNIVVTAFAANLLFHPPNDKLSISVHPRSSHHVTNAGAVTAFATC